MKKVLFCHGMPGSQKDADLLCAANPNAEVIAIDLLSFPPESMDLAFANALGTKSIATHQGGISLVGFSIGAMAAIKIAAAHPQSG
ncbi:MAG: alpha/beta fold hydrolase [Paracoccaceae bacterium]